MSWNIMSRTAVDALLRAQARGVKVRVLMDNTNLVDIPNPGFKRLKASFKRANQRMDIKQSRRSYAKTCMQSCRGVRGRRTRRSTCSPGRARPRTSSCRDRRT